MITLIGITGIDGKIHEGNLEKHYYMIIGIIEENRWNKYQIQEVNYCKPSKNIIAILILLTT